MSAGVRGIDEPVESPPRSKWWWLVAVFCAVALVVGIYDLLIETDEEAAAGALSRLFEEIREADGEGICAAITPASRERMVLAEQAVTGNLLACPKAALREAEALELSSREGLEELDQEDIEETLVIDDDCATLSTQDGPVPGLTVVRTDGEWLVNLAAPCR